jgi:hypothetical protein
MMEMQNTNRFEMIENRRSDDKHSTAGRESTQIEQRGLASCRVHLPATQHMA